MYEWAWAGALFSSSHDGNHRICRCSVVLQGEDYLAFLGEKVALGRGMRVTCFEEPHPPHPMAEMGQSCGLEALRLRVPDCTSPGGCRRGVFWCTTPSWNPTELLKVKESSFLSA